MKAKSIKSFDENECPICYSSPQVDKAHPDSCGHVFCHQSLERWSRSKPVCPVCNTEFFEIIRINNRAIKQYYDSHIKPASKKSKLKSVLKKAAKISVAIIIAIPVLAVVKFNYC